MILTIDPGVPAGYALWDDGVTWGAWKLKEHGVFRSTNTKWDQRLIAVCHQLNYLLRHNHVHAYIEQPRFFASEKGRASAEGDALTKLALAAGAMFGVCAGLKIPVSFVPVNQWKGQMPKRMVIDRIRKVLPDFDSTSHDADAVGIGLYLQGKL